MLKVENLKKSFNVGTEYQLDIFEDFNLHLETGKCTALIGSNGCGKSTLFNLISGTIPVDGGKITLDNEDITKMKEEKRASYVSRVYQNPSDGVSPSLSILENMSLAYKKGERFTLKRLINYKNIGLFKEMLRTLDLGLEDKLNTKVKYLSGGQRQCLSLLMATMKQPKILLLDEHTAALDPKTSRLLMEITSELIKEKNITTLMISHNMKDAIEYSDRVIMLNEGKIVFDKESDILTEKDLLDIYTEKMMSVSFNRTRKLAV